MEGISHEIFNLRKRKGFFPREGQCVNFKALWGLYRKDVELANIFPFVKMQQKCDLSTDPNRSS